MWTLTDLRFDLYLGSVPFRSRGLNHHPPRAIDTPNAKHIETGFLEAFLRAATGAASVSAPEPLQELWSGYGSIARYRLARSKRSTVILKRIRPPSQARHPRGWNTSRSHDRKLRSYQVEARWYQYWAQRCGDACRTPDCFAVERRNGETLIVLEDLDAAGYPERRSVVTLCEAEACLRWLARFHATFLGEPPEGLWPTGTYWHLDTRPDELAALEDAELRAAAPLLDRALADCPFQTIVHGDAKLANFCFAPSGDRVAAVDFQYVGGGCGMKDVAYFIGSCYSDQECERHEAQLLDTYFAELAAAVAELEKPIDTAALEAAWRALFAIAWTDFHRFLKGWSPEHWKLHSYSERLARQTIERISQ